MQKLFFLIIILIITNTAFSLEKLKQDYLVTYGNPNARITLIHYYSFKCPHCIKLFQAEFKDMKIKYLDTNQVYWIFHPVPMDLLTIQGMDCLKNLNPREKRIFLEAILEETALDNPELSVLMMQRAMEVFGKPIPKLNEKEYVGSIPAFQDAFEFLKQEEKISAIPTVEINGILFVREVPDKVFIETKINDLLRNSHEN